MKRHIIIAIYFMIYSAVIGHINHASANDEGLYNPLPPADSAFIRFIAHPSYQGSLTITANNKTYNLSETGIFSDYYVMPKGSVKIQNNNDVIVDAGALYSIILHPHNIEMIKDPSHENMKKAQIIAYNLSPYPEISLKTSNGKIDIIKNIKMSHVALRAINPVKIKTALYVDQQEMTLLPEISMTRGRSYSIAVFDKDIAITWAENKTDTTK